MPVASGRPAARRRPFRSPSNPSRSSDDLTGSARRGGGCLWHGGRCLRHGVIRSPAATTVHSPAGGSAATIVNTGRQLVQRHPGRTGQPPRPQPPRSATRSGRCSLLRPSSRSPVPTAQPGTAPARCSHRRAAASVAAHFQPCAGSFLIASRTLTFSPQGCARGSTTQKRSALLVQVRRALRHHPRVHLDVTAADKATMC
jgi:hypothetical protein